MRSFTYLFLDLISLSFPLFFSRSEKFGFGKRLPQAWLAVALTAFPFIAWDIFFTHTGVWNFNSEYLLGFYFQGLPLEEILFFFTIPFSCLFIYAQFQKSTQMQLNSRLISVFWLSLSLLFFSIALTHLHKNYTVVVMLLGAATSILLACYRPLHAGAIVITLLIHYVPFFLINGTLTALPVVIYRPQEILGIHLFTIPVEDAVYSFVMVVTVIYLFEILIKGKAK